VSVAVHALPSVHVVPLAFAGFEHAPVGGSHVPAVWHWSCAVHVTAVPAVQLPLASQVSAPLHALPSLHVVPLATGAWCTPVGGSQLSVVHWLLSSMGGAVPATHVPEPLHASTPLHALPSVHVVPLATGVCVTPPAGLHASVVHGLLSSVATLPVPVHAPAWHVSVAVHALPSVHVVPLTFAGFEHAPVGGSHVPAVWHWSCAVHVTAMPAVQLPLALQISAPLHALPSLHDVPPATGRCTTPNRGLQVSAVQGLPSSMTGGTPA
jgi:hypothetical protein